MTTGIVQAGIEQMRGVHRRLGAPSPKGAVDRLRMRGVIIIAGLGWCSLAVLLATSLLLQNSALSSLLTIGIIVNIAPTIMAFRGRYDAEARAIVGTLAAVMPGLLVYALRGHEWQMDGHMYFFVALAVLAVMCDWKPIAIACGLIAAHHILFEFVAPEWVFTGGGNISRVAFHSVAVIFQLAVLSYLTTQLERLLAQQDTAVEQSRRLVATAQAERKRTSEALEAARIAEHQTAAERAQRERVEHRTATDRHAELRTLANEFERTVSTVVKSIENAAEQLADSSTHLSDIAQEAGREADDVAVSAADASSEISDVAASLRSLSASISAIAGAAQQQDATTKSAYAQGRHSVQAIKLLVEEASRISSFVDMIKTIAAKTNMLALNATIEAARAGEAGRGFVVVANEVKSLASDASSASDQIALLLDSIRDGATGSMIRVEGVTSSVHEVAQAAGEIATTVNDQRKDATKIENSASRAASNADAVEHRIGRVAFAVTAASTLSAEVRRSAGELLADASKLRFSTDRFVQFLREDD